MDTPAPRKPQRTPRPPKAQAVQPRLGGDAPEGYLAVGRVVGVHGLRGEIKVEPYTDFPERFDVDSVLLLGEDLDEVTVRASRPHKGNYLIALDEVEDRNDAEALRGMWLYVAEADAAALEENAYWVHDILGLTAVTEEGETLGTIYDVLFTGANEVYVVRNAGSPPREILLPATDEVVRAVDLPTRRMTVRLLPGMLD